MKASSVESELEAIRLHLAALSRQARSGREAFGVVQVLERLAVSVDGLQRLAESLRVENEELLETRRAVEVERQRYLTLFEFAPDGYVVTNVAGVIQESNRAAAALFRTRQELLLGKPLALYVAADEHNAFRTRLAGLPTEKEIHGWEVPFHLRTGERIHAAVNVIILRAPESAPASLHWIIRDIT